MLRQPLSACSEQESGSLPALEDGLVEHCIKPCLGRASTIYSNVEVVRQPGADLGESRLYNIDLAPKVTKAPQIGAGQAKNCI